MKCSKPKEDCQSHFWLRIDQENMKIIGTRNESEASIFNITGKINKNCFVTCTIEG